MSLLEFPINIDNWEINSKDDKYINFKLINENVFHTDNNDLFSDKITLNYFNKISPINSKDLKKLGNILFDNIKFLKNVILIQ